MASQQTTSSPSRAITTDHVFYKPAGRAITHPITANSDHEAITPITFSTKPQVKRSRFQTHRSRTDRSRSTPPLYRGVDGRSSGHIQLNGKGNTMARTSESTWAPIPGYEGLYEASTDGDIRSLDRWVTHTSRYTGSNHRQFTAGRILKPGVRRDGHTVVVLRRDGSGGTQLVHRLVMLAFVGECPPGHEVCHNNGIPDDNRLTNLRYGTQSENSLDRVRHGTHNMSIRTECPQGHPYDDENTYIWAGRRNCKACRRAYKRAWEAQKRAAS